MTAGTFLIALTVVVLVLLIWHLRWVLVVLFGAVVVAVALDVLIVQVQKRTPLERPQALAAVLGISLLAGGAARATAGAGTDQPVPATGSGSAAVGQQGVRPAEQ